MEMENRGFCRPGGLAKCGGFAPEEDPTPLRVIHADGKVVKNAGEIQHAHPRDRRSECKKRIEVGNQPATLR